MKAETIFLKSSFFPRERIPVLAIGFLVLLGSGSGPCLHGQEAPRQIQVDPVEVVLSGRQANYSLLVHGQTAAGDAIDWTHQCRFQSLDPRIAEVSDKGRIHAVSDGATKVIVHAAGKTFTVAVTVTGTSVQPSYHFENDIVPILSRHGCNAAGCHGKAEGQNGFKLSVFGFDPEADYTALIQEARGRRVLFTAPEQSLFLLKASGAMAHGGGTRINKANRDYETLRGWIAAGAPFGDPQAPRVVSIEVTPGERILAMKGAQQLRVVATYSDGHKTDVTALAKFQSNHDGLAAVDENGLVTAGEIPGQAAIMASFLGAVDIFRVLVPRGEKIDAYPALAEKNFIDTLVFRQLKKLNIVPSEPARDEEYLRRVYLDVIGTLPTAAEAKRFLDDQRENKRALLVEELLQRPEFADYWALKWADLLQVDRQKLGHKRAYAFYQWIRKCIAANKPHDQMARELLAAEGPLDQTGPANFYQVVSKPGDRASALSQVFLGVRIACAECHHHPFDRWSQTDYYGMQAFFTPVRVQKSGRGDILITAAGPQISHPRTKEPIFAHPLGTKMPAADPSGDRRGVLAEWLTAPENPWFARNFANRVWASFLGRGLVEPVDDVRATNPPSNPELLDALGKHVVESQFDLKQLIRTITSSHVYQLSSKPNATNIKDEMNYSRALFRRINAEVLLDMVSQTTGIAETFDGMPPGYRAIQLWDSSVANDFLKMFGRPARVSACECERNVEATVSQVLHFLNSPRIQGKLEHERGMIARLVQVSKSDTELVNELYLTFFSRFPTDQERSNALQYLQRFPDQRRHAVEDLAWSMLNSMEFLFNH
jgi:hypothetical protein